MDVLVVMPSIPRSPPNLCLHPVKVNAALAIADRTAPPVPQAQMVTMASMVSPANPEIADKRLLTEAPPAEADKNNARAKLPPETPVPKDPVDPMDPPVTLVHQVTMEPQAAQDQLDHPDPLETPETMAAQDQPANQAESPEPNKARQAHPEPTVNPAAPDPQVIQAPQAKMAALAAPALPEMPEHQAMLAKLAAPVVKETPAKMARPAAANTAHQLVWLQVIKRRLRVRFGGDAEFDQQSTPSIIRSPSNDFFFQNPFAFFNFINMFSPFLVLLFFGKLIREK